mgnify:CR=1 FL=1
MTSPIKKCMKKAVNGTAILLVTILSIPTGILSFTILMIEKGADTISAVIEKDPS